MPDQKDTDREMIANFRAARGTPDNPFARRPMLLLTTTGAKSGQARTKPMMYVRDGDRLLVIASNAGAPRHPDWYHNLVAHPDVTVEIGEETFPARAVVLTGDERARLWAQITQAHSFFADHQAHVTREIPVVALERQEN